MENLNSTNKTMNCPSLTDQTINIEIRQAMYIPHNIEAHLQVIAAMEEQ